MKGLDIGIITGYSGQKELLRKSIKATGLDKIASKIDINTLDAFQGRENDIIIYGQLSTLLLLNKDISTKDLIPGALEPQKFQNLQWKEINLSVQRKTACIGAIAKQAELDKLHTQASYWRKHGGFFYGIRNLLSNFWFRLIGLIIGIISGILTIYQYLN